MGKLAGSPKKNGKRKTKKSYLLDLHLGSPPPATSTKSKKSKGETDQNQATRRRPDNHKPQISQAGVAETSREERDRGRGSEGGGGGDPLPPVENPSRCVFFFW